MNKVKKALSLIPLVKVEKVVRGVQSTVITYKYVNDTRKFVGK